MSKLLGVKRLGHNQFQVDVQLEAGNKERWTYVREETSTGTSFNMVEREDL